MVTIATAGVCVCVSVAASQYVYYGSTYFGVNKQWYVSSGTDWVPECVPGQSTLQTKHSSGGSGSFLLVPSYL